MKKFLFATFATLVAVSAGCKTNNALYCDQTTPCPGTGVCDLTLNSCSPPPDATPPDAPPPDATPLCTVDPAICVTGSATPVCKTSDGTCVQCAASTDCTGTTPVCDTASNTCGACSAHSDCASDVCLPSGACADATTVAYVSETGADNVTCSLAMPCATVTAALATTKNTVKISGAIIDSVTVGAARDVTMFADTGASLTGSASPAAATITLAGANPSLTIFDLTIKNGAAAGNAVGILVDSSSSNAHLSLTQVTLTNNQGGGIVAGGPGASLVVVQSTISDNQGGGISLTAGSFDIVNNMFFDNGGVSSLVGGVNLSTAANSANRLQFNSFSANSSGVGGSAIQCAIIQGLAASNNIISGADTYANELGGNCTIPYSILFSSTNNPGAPPTPTGLLTADPMFVTSPTGDLHITAGSPARGAADPQADLTGLASVDFDGELRVAPTDIGADQFSTVHH